jgi:hypothetical protein
MSVAILSSRRASDPENARVFRSRGDAGNGGLRRLLAALASGTVRMLVIDTRFNGHSAVRGAVAACRRGGIAYCYR